jgi:hypothetical protein
MDLVKLESKLPLKAYPEQELNKIILTQLTVWLSSLLSLTDEVSANRLEIALPAIKEHCWSMGFDEVKKIFILYADGKLSVKPIPNYFDRILLGKIIEAYKEQKFVVKKPIETEISEDEKKDLINSGITKCLAHYENETKILEGYNHFLYDVLFDDGYLPKDKETKLQALEDAKIITQMELEQKPASSLKEFKEIKQKLDKIQNDENLKLITKAKELMVLKFLRETIKNKDTFNQLKEKYQ